MRSQSIVGKDLPECRSLHRNSAIKKTASTDGYRIGKYKIKPNATNRLDNDFPFLRYADVLMIKADEAAVVVTDIRKRAFKNNPEKATVTGADLVKGSRYKYGYQATDGSITERQGGDDIKFGRFINELGWEFAAEAHRRQDLIRFGVDATKKWFNHRPQTGQRALFPIPQAEPDKNTNLKQDPGY